MKRSIEKIPHTELQTTGNRDGLTAGHSGTRRPFNRHSRSGKLDEVGWIASVERQLEDPLILDYLTNACSACLHQRRVGLNLDRFRDLAHLQHSIYDRI